MATELPRFTISVDDELFEFIEEYQHRNRYPNRNMAINALLKAGYEALKNQTDTTPKKPTRKKRKQQDEGEKTEIYIEPEEEEWQCVSGEDSISGC